MHGHRPASHSSTSCVANHVGCLTECNREETTRCESGRRKRAFEFGRGLDKWSGRGRGRGQKQPYLHARVQQPSTPPAAIRERSEGARAKRVTVNYVNENLQRSLFGEVRRKKGRGWVELNSPLPTFSASPSASTPPTTSSNVAIVAGENRYIFTEKEKK